MLFLKRMREEKPLGVLFSFFLVVMLILISGCIRAVDENNSGNIIHSIYELKLGLNDIEDMRSENWLSRAVVLDDGNVFILRVSNYEREAEAEIFNLENLKFRLVTDKSKFEHTLPNIVKLKNGNVLIFSLDGFEIFNVKEELFSPVSSPEGPMIVEDLKGKAGASLFSVEADNNDVIIYNYLYKYNKDYTPQKYYNYKYSILENRVVKDYSELQALIKRTRKSDTPICYKDNPLLTFSSMNLEEQAKMQELNPQVIILSKGNYLLFSQCSNEPQHPNKAYVYVSKKVG